MKKLMVAVLFGGKSGEHEVSIWSSQSVLEYIDRTKFEVLPILIDKMGQWYRGKTIQLVKQAKLVIAHSSISIGFANLFRKPIIFINDAELNKMPVSCYLIKAMSEAHGKKQIFIDSGEVAKIDWKKEMKIDKKAYDNYKEDYIKNKGSPNLPFWQIVADRLKQ